MSLVVRISQILEHTDWPDMEEVRNGELPEIIQAFRDEGWLPPDEIQLKIEEAVIDNA